VKPVCAVERIEKRLIARVMCATEQIIAARFG
jgi:hypothetical protein